MGLLEELLVEAIEDDDFKLFALRIKQGAKVYGFMHDELKGKSALHCAVELGRVEMVRKLVEVGADPNEADRNGKSAVHLACRCRQLEIAHILMHDGPGDPDMACQDNVAGWRPLHFIAKYCHGSTGEAFAKLFVESSFADVNGTSLFGETPLHVCAQSDNEAVAKVLLCAQQQQEQQLQQGSGTETDNTLPPIGVAALHGSNKVSKLLIENGSNIYQHCRETMILEQPNGKPIGIARQHGNPKLALQMIRDMCMVESKREEEVADLINQYRPGRETW